MERVRCTTTWRRSASLALLLAACAHPTPRTAAESTAIHRPAPAQATVLSRDERWRADLHYLAAELPRRHPDFFALTTREAFARAVTELDSAIPRLSDVQIRYRLLRLTAMLHDGHTLVPPPWPPRTRLPIEVFWTDDGPYVTAASARYAALVGRRIVAIDGRPASSVGDTLRLYLPHENEQGFRNLASLIGWSPEMLHGMGIARDSTRLTLDLEDPAGAVSRVELSAVAWADFAPVAPAAGEPLYRRRRTEKYWWTYLPETRTVYVKYNECRDREDFRRLADSVVRAIDARRPRRVVIDLRDNGGGDSRVIRPLIDSLRVRPRANRADALFVIIGRRTFSSGQMAAIELKQKTNATSVGEPTGERPNTYGEVKTFELPNSRLVVMHSSKFFRLMPQDGHALTPDVIAPPTVRSLLEGRDPALDWIMGRRPPARERPRARRARGVSGTREAS